MGMFYYCTISGWSKSWFSVHEAGTAEPFDVSPLFVESYWKNRLDLKNGLKKFQPIKTLAGLNYPLFSIVSTAETDTTMMHVDGSIKWDDRNNKDPVQY